MKLYMRTARLFATVLLPVLAVALVATPVAVSAQATIQRDDPWIYRGTDIPVDREWVFGELENGLRYAVRTNRVPPGQVSIRLRIDAGSLHEADQEQGFAHLLEHLVFRNIWVKQQPFLHGRGWAPLSAAIPTPKPARHTRSTSSTFPRHPRPSWPKVSVCCPV